MNIFPSSSTVRQPKSKWLVEDKVFWKKILSVRWKVREIRRKIFFQKFILTLAKRATVDYLRRAVGEKEMSTAKWLYTHSSLRACVRASRVRACVLWKYSGILCHFGKRCAFNKMALTPRGGTVFRQRNAVECLKACPLGGSLLGCA